MNDWLVDMLEWVGFDEDTNTRRFVRWCVPSSISLAKMTRTVLMFLGKWTALLVGAVLYFSVLLLTTVLVSNILMPMSRLVLTFFIKTHGEGHHGRVTCLAPFTVTEDESVESPRGDKSESDGDIGFVLGSGGSTTGRDAEEDSDEPPTLKLITGSEDCAVVR